MSPTTPISVTSVTSAETSQPVREISSVFSATKTPLGRWGLYVVLPALGAMGLAAQTQWNQEAAQELALQTQALNARTATVLQRAHNQALVPNLLQRFRAEFPSYESRHQRVADFMQRLASLGGMTPNTSFNQSTVADTGLLAYALSLNTTVPYSDWRDFMDDVLADDAALSLTSLRLSRTDASVPQLRVQAVFTFYMQAPESVSP